MNDEIQEARVANKVNENSTSARDAATGKEAHSSSRSKSVNISRWFWGTIILLAIASMSLAMMSNLRQENEPQVEQAQGEQVTTTPETVKPIPIELEPSKFRQMFNEANAAAKAAAVNEVSKLVEEAFVPAFDNISSYTDWHYSVWGSYKELYDGAIGDPETEVEKRLLGDLKYEINKILPRSDIVFNETFQQYLDKEFDAIKTPEIILGDLTKEVFKDAAIQTGGQVVLAGGGALVAKNLSAIIAKKMAAKIAAKAGGKWFAKLGPAGAGVLACAWAGPGAAACGIVAGVLGWLGVDFLVNSLDEAITRDDFEATLRQELNNSKANLVAQITESISAKASRQKFSLDKGVQDFTLKQLSEANVKNICSKYEPLRLEYENIASQMSLRSEKNIQQLQTKAEDLAQTLGLFEAANEIATNLAYLDNVATIIPINVSTKAPLKSDYASNRKVSGSLTLNGAVFDINKQKTKKDARIFLKVSKNTSKDQAPIARSTTRLRAKLELEQHLYFGNRFFVGSKFISWDDLTSNGSTNSIQLQLREENSGSGAPSVPVQLKLNLQAAKIPKLLFGPEC